MDLYTSTLYAAGLMASGVAGMLVLASGASATRIASSVVRVFKPDLRGA